MTPVVDGLDPEKELVMPRSAWLLVPHIRTVVVKKSKIIAKASLPSQRQLVRH